MILVLAAVEAALGVLFWVVFIQALLSWLPGVVDQTAWLRSAERAMAHVSEPLLNPIREHMPGGATVDFSPMILLLLIEVVRWLLPHLIA